MPLYQVLERGFMNGQLYDPKGKRRTLSSPQPLKPVPSWLKPMEEKKETAAEKKERLAAEAAQAQAAADKAKEDKIDKDELTFINPDAKPASTVTTL